MVRRFRSRHAVRASARWRRVRPPEARSRRRSASAQISGTSAAPSAFHRADLSHPLSWQPPNSCAPAAGARADLPRRGRTRLCGRHISDTRATRGARQRQDGEEKRMSEKVYPVPAEWAQRAYVNDAKYTEMYARSVTDPEGFWREQAQRIDWIKPFTRVKNTRYAPDVSIKWYEDGTLNVSARTASTGTSRRAATRSRSSGRATTRRIADDHLSRAPPRGLSPSPMCSRSSASSAATASPSTCR